MHETSDVLLLREYAEKGNEAAFREIVLRHTDLIYSAALRQVNSPDLAGDVAQRVFTDLARKCRSVSRTLNENASVLGWLYRSTRFAALNLLRDDRRRQAHERQIMEQFDSGSETTDEWDSVRPVLDEAMAELRDIDREALLLRFFKRHDFRAIGHALGVSEDAAQKRVTRALEHLRGEFTRRGVTTTAIALSTALTGKAVAAAPPGLGITLSRLALAGSTVSKTTTITQAIAMTSLQKAVISASVLLLLSTLMYKAYRRSDALIKSEQTVPATGAVDKPSLKARPESHGLANTRRHTQKSEFLAKAKTDLRAALHPQALRRGVRSYPPEELIAAIRNFGVDRKEAFPLLLEALADSDLEVRSRAISAMGLVGRKALPELGLIGEPAPEAKTVLWKTMRENDELAATALSACRTIGFTPSDIPELADTLLTATNLMLKRYLPEAIADAISKDPSGAAAYSSSVETLLHSPDENVQFEAACALARSQAASNPAILQNLIAGLARNSSQQLMALETMQTLGSTASPGIQAILEFVNSTTDDGLREIGYKTLGKINGDLRNSSAEVDQALKSEETMAYWNEKFASGNYRYQDLLDALKEPVFAATAAKHLGEWGASAKAAVPELITSLAGQDQNRREQILDAIHQIDPDASITKVSSEGIVTAAQSAIRSLESKSDNQRQPAVAKLLDKVMMMNSDWYTTQEIVALARQLAARDQDVYRAFVEQVARTEPTLATLFTSK
jgi:RNA polymerase sigma factor (sigma-70 family)